MSASTIRQDIVNIPNLLTLFRIFLIPVVCLFIYNGDAVSGMIAAILFVVASVTDWLDGYIARRQGLVSMTGKFLDPLADKLLVNAALVMLLPLGRMAAWLVIVIVSRELAVSGLRSLAAGNGLIIAAGEGGKFKTAFQMTGLIGLIIHYTYEVNFVFASYMINFHRTGYWLLAISTVFSLYSAWQYFHSFLQAIDKQAPGTTVQSRDLAT